jgi:hypothetical protein
MTEKITKLTSEQEAKLPEYRDKWISIGLSTEPVTDEEMKTALAEAYTCAGLKPPETYEIFDDPLSAARRVTELLGKTGLDKKNIFSEACYGQQDAGWLGFYDYLQEVCGLDAPKKMSGLRATARTCGWWWPFDQTVIVSRKISEIHRLNNRLHNANGMAISWANGVGYYAWKGIIVDERLIMHHETITGKEILEEKNTEIRRIMIERMGAKKFLNEMKAELVEETELGKLWRVSVKGDEDVKIIEMVNSTPEPDGTHKKYYERVPPDMARVRQALAWQAQVEENSYSPDEES